MTFVADLTYLKIVHKIRSGTAPLVHIKRKKSTTKIGKYPNSFSALHILFIYIKVNTADYRNANQQITNSTSWQHTNVILAGILKFPLSKYLGISIPKWCVAFTDLIPFAEQTVTYLGSLLLQAP